MSTVLSTRQLSKSFGSFSALSEVSIDIAAGSRHALIGPNGAGKTTLLNLLMGELRPSRGDVFLREVRITDEPQHRRVKRGMARSFQINTLFPGLTPLESVVLAICEREGIGGVWHRSVASLQGEIDEASSLLATVGLLEDGATPTQRLAYGKQRLLEIGLALATRPTVLLLDEPAAGIPVAQSTEMFQVLAALPSSVTVIFIEHDLDLVFRFSERISVLAEGRVLMEGAPAEVAGDPRVREVYLGMSMGV